MPADDRFAQWAALFLRSVDGDGPAAHGEALDGGNPYLGVTPAARDLLRSVDAGGVPAFVTGALRQIASENGIEVGAGWTPNEIVEALRGRAGDHPAAMPGPGD